MNTDGWHTDQASRKTAAGLFACCHFAPQTKRLQDAGVSESEINQESPVSHFLFGHTEESSEGYSDPDSTTMKHFFN